MPPHRRKNVSILKSKALWGWYGIAALILVLDQITKLWAESALAGGEVVVLTSWFRLELAYNTGAAFSLLYDAGGWQRWLFSGLAIAVSVGIVIWIARLVASRTAGRHWELLALALILGGALGNVYDRILLGHVVDFVVWHYQQYHWPTFNIADSAISVGAALLIVDMLFVQSRQSRTQAKSN
ncbi:signal peptidase II [Gilvimarinus sp. F26214L]|uniref:signal peptidase II n=1 Tax=Gilvimarinus sp. DZF01 TaxID=3461371 RepID=UPI0040454962